MRTYAVTYLTAGGATHTVHVDVPSDARAPIRSALLRAVDALGCGPEPSPAHARAEFEEAVTGIELLGDTDGL